MRTTICAVLLILVGLAQSLVSAEAQPGMTTYWTIEAKIDQADHVVLGTMSKVVRNVIVPPGGHTKEGTLAPEGQTEYIVTLKVEDVLKGDLKGNADKLRVVRIMGQDRRYEAWSQEQTSFLWFLGTVPVVGEGRSWEVLPLGKPIAAEAGQVTLRAVPMFSLDFTVLRDEEALLARARAYAKTASKTRGIHVMEIPYALGRQCSPIDGSSELVVPVEPSLERRAHQLIASPQDFLPKGEKLDPLSRYLLCFGGVSALRYFKSDANATVLCSLLDDKLDVSDIRVERRHPVGTKAYEVLLHWGMDAPLPKSADKMTLIDLAGTDVTDASLQKLAQFKNITRLDLRNTKVTHEGLKHLAGLRKLTWLGLSEGQVSDANLRVLHQIGLLHTSSPCTGKDGERPQSWEEVVALTLCRGPVTDEGLRELADLHNLAWLDLRETQVTDAGLKNLAGLKKLTRVLLQGSRVTRVGIDELRIALPNCKIDH